MKLTDLKPAAGSKKARRRVGRGIGSGRGKTAGRGQKGQKSRSGFSQRAGWEGGRSSLIMRLPKRGFNRQKELFQLVQLGDLNVFEEGTVVTAAELRASGLIRHADRPIKLLGKGELETRGLTITVDVASRSAYAAVTAAGGTVHARVGGAAAEAAAPAAESDAAQGTESDAAADPAEQGSGTEEQG